MSFRLSIPKAKVRKLGADFLEPSYEEIICPDIVHQLVFGQEMCVLQ